MHQNYLFYFIDEQVMNTLHTCETTQLCQEAIRTHGLDETASQLFAESATGSVLIGSFLSVKESINVKFIFPDLECFCSFEVNCLGQLRGYISSPQFDFPATHLKDKIKTIQIQSLKAVHGQSELYESHVRSQTNSLETAINHFYLQSIQTESFCRLAVVLENTRPQFCGGAILQKLPGPTDAPLSTCTSKLASPNFLQDFLAAKDDPDKLLDTFLNGQGKLILKEQTQFICNCSKDVFSQSLMQLAMDELQSLLTEDKETEIVCHYCNAQYQFDHPEIERIIQNKQNNLT